MFKNIMITTITIIVFIVWYLDMALWSRYIQYDHSFLYWIGEQRTFDWELATDMYNVIYKPN